jgi:hypothetical protein
MPYLFAVFIGVDGKSCYHYIEMRNHEGAFMSVDSMTATFHPRLIAYN